jgi:membrane-associated phospholipid phosphatase
MYAFEELAGGYFAVIAGAAPFAPARGYRRATAAVTAVVLVGLVAVAAAWAGAAVRMWLPVVYLIAGYWLPALLVADADAGGTAPASGFERWLRRSDQRLRAVLFTVPRLMRELVEFAYLMCYPLVPIAFVVVWVLGTPADVDRFWIAVLAAGFACYITLPWLVSRPPRAILAATLNCRTQAANVTLLRHVSHQLNTFPSGHVAVSLTAAAAVAAVAPAAGLLLGVMAVAIAVGAASGAYHYVVDVLLGAVVAAAVVAMVFL